jgi:hypothetical protein
MSRPFVFVRIYTVEGKNNFRRELLFRVEVQEVVVAGRETEFLPLFPSNTRFLSEF